MSNTITSPYMGLVIPLPGLQTGPLYATQLNASLLLVDQHNHTSGQGLQVPTAGLNINSDLAFNSFNGISLRTTRYDNQSGVLAQVTDVGCIYVVSGDMYYNDYSGNNIKITAAGAVNTASSGNITGMGSTTASVAYTAFNTTFTFNSNTNTPANMKTGPLAIGLNSVSPKFWIIQANSGQASDLTLTLPSALPSSNAFTFIDNTGLMSTIVPDNSTITISGSIVKVPTGGISATQIANGTITTTQISNSAGITGTQIAANTIIDGNIVNLTITAASLAANSITTAKITDANVTRAKLVAVGQQITSSSGGFTTGSASYTAVTNLGVTITTTGRPVMLLLQGDGTDADSSIVGNVGIYGRGAFFRGATQLAQFMIPAQDSVGAGSLGLGSMMCLDAVGAGTYTYTLQVKQTTGGAGNLFVRQMVLVAYEL